MTLWSSSLGNMMAAVALGDSIDNTISDYFVTSDISKELSAWIFIISFEDTRMLAAVDAVLGVPFYITLLLCSMWIVLRHRLQWWEIYMQRHMAVIYSMGDPKESESKIDSSFETNIIENFYYGNNYNARGWWIYRFWTLCILCSSDKLQMEYSGYYKNPKIWKKGKASVII